MSWPTEKRWTAEKVDAVAGLVAEGRTVAEIAELMGCSQGALRAAANRWRISLRRPGQPVYGSVLGEPRKRPPARDYVHRRYRRAVALGLIDPEALWAPHWRSEYVCEGDEPPTCHVCDERPATVQQRSSVGPCAPCQRAILEAAVAQALEREPAIRSKRATRAVVTRGAESR